MEEIKKAARKLDVQIGMLKFRFIGNLIIILFLTITIVYILTTERVYVINTNGGIWASDVENRKNPDILYIESDDHIRKFYATFLTFNHTNYSDQISKSYSLGGNVIKKFHNTLKDEGFFNEIIANNYRVKSSVSKVNIVENQNEKMQFYVEGKMILENDFIREIRNMNMEVVMVLIPRVMILNPHGLSIENIKLPENANKTLSKEFL